VAFSVLFDALTVLVFAFYLAADGPRLRRTIASWLPPQRQKVLLTVWDISLAKTGGFVVSKLILATISAIAHAAFFWFIDLPYWLPMGVFAGVTSQLIPTIGTYIGVAVPMLIGVLDNPISVVWIVLFATIYQQIENYVLTPRVSRATMDIHPAVALGAVFVGLSIWGPIGALIGIPIAAAVIAVVATYGQRYELISEMHDGELTDTTPPADIGEEPATPSPS
jgi:predicted PurR-regulated permease PerM